MMMMMATMTTMMVCGRRSKKRGRKRRHAEVCTVPIAVLICAFIIAKAVHYCQSISYAKAFMNVKTLVIAKKR